MSATRQRVRGALTEQAPGLLAWRWRLTGLVRGPDWPLDATPSDPAADAELVERLGTEVRGGPFAGMRLVEGAVCSRRWPKLAGTYEAELHDLVEECVARGYDRVVNVGAAEGYYAVGMALRLPDAGVVAVDPLPGARRRTARNAAANGVADRVTTVAASSRRALDRQIGRGALVLMDCEGAEVGLLDPVRCPALARSDILVEVHEFDRPGLGDALADRFAGTHDVRRIDQRARAAIPAVLDGAGPDLVARAVDERRARRLHWLFLDRLAPGAAG